MQVKNSKLVYEKTDILLIKEKIATLKKEIAFQLHGIHYFQKEYKRNNAVCVKQILEAKRLGLKRFERALTQWQKILKELESEMQESVIFS